jgi:glycosyltransferase involved in cell wall biosynthesis
VRILHLGVFESYGGAGRAAARLHHGLVEAGVDSLMLVRERTSEDGAVRLPGSPLRRALARNRAYVDQAIPLAYRRRTPGVFTTALLPDGIARDVRDAGPDLVNVHWVGEGFVRPETLGHLGRPLVWTLHDSYAFTGGCHVPHACLRYAERCGACPALGSTSDTDLSRWIWNRKRRAWRDVALAAVAPSRWMAGAARSSALLGGRRVEVIPNGVDTTVYRPLAQGMAREILRLPSDRKLILFSAVLGAADPNKGFRFLEEALRRLSEAGRGDSIALVVAGAPAIPEPERCGVRVHCVGHLSDDVSLALLYAAVDAVVVPSMLENLPNAIVEAFACGRPAIGFRVGGNPDLVRDRANGALVEPFDTAALADAIWWVVEDETRWRGLSAAARATAEAEHGLDVQARRYVALYEDLLRGVPPRV